MNSSYERGISDLKELYVHRYINWVHLVVGTIYLLFFSAESADQGYVGNRKCYNFLGKW